MQISDIVTPTVTRREIAAARVKVCVELRINGESKHKIASGLATPTSCHTMSQKISQQWWLVHGSVL